jgi:membrane dipeptidase
MKTAKKIIKDNIVVDNAFGFEPEIEVPHKWEVIDRFKAAGFTHISLSIATDMTSLSNTMHYLAEVTAMINQNPDKYLLVQTHADILKAKQENKIALSFMFQGTNPLEKRMELVDIFSKLGVRSMILSYNARNAIGDGVIEPSDIGLSRLGKLLIQKMNAAGMIIDLSHTGRQTSMDAIKLSTQPVIFSHSNVNNIHPHMRNLIDEQIKAIAVSGGFIGINGNGPLLGDDNASIEKFVDHVEYIINLIGEDYVGLGTDLVYFPEIFDAFMKKNSVVYPDNYGVGKASQFKSIQPEQITEIVEELQKRGHNEITIAKILGGNYMRVAKQVWNQHV